jgi:putative membrane protein
LWFSLGTLSALLVSVARPRELPGDWWVMMLGGSVAICAMILPGISGSFILLLLGLYTVFIQALSDINLVLLVSFAAGAGFGLLLFARFLSWLLASYYQATLAVLTGFLLGSLNVIWPWKQVIETRLDRHGELIPVVQKNLAPWQYEALVGQESQWLPAILFTLLGFALVLVLEFVSKPAVNEQDK